MRTVKRLALPLNAGKQQALESLLQAYALEKQFWLREFEKQSLRPFIGSTRKVRDAAIKAGHTSTLPARLWKLALIEAAETWVKYWEALFVTVRAKAHRNQQFTDEQRHYLHTVLNQYPLFFAVLEGGIPATKLGLSPAQQRQVTRWLLRTVKQRKGRPPSVRHQRSIPFDANCYRAFDQNGVQYIAVMSLNKGQRVTLPLKGITAIRGNIRVVLTRTTVEVHQGFELRGRTPLTGRTEAIDFGYTEAFTDTEGVRYGTQLGVLTTTVSDYRCDKGAIRNKLRALVKRYSQSNDPALQAKAHHIRRHNLGSIKWDAREARAKASIACEINQALNQLLKTKKPKTLVSEDLRHDFTYRLPKTVNRRLAAWTRGILQDRVAFKGAAEGFCHKVVNAAYSSQTCPKCGYVDGKNRTDDAFLCLHCGYANRSDHVAATNLQQRESDPEITRYTPYQAVKRILLERFHRRVEAEALLANVTVPGRTLDTDSTPPRAKMKKGPGKSQGRRSIKERNIQIRL